MAPAECTWSHALTLTLSPLSFAEFVQMAPAECVYRDGAQVVLRPPRLSLARISGETRRDERGADWCADTHSHLPGANAPLPCSHPTPNTDIRTHTHTHTATPPPTHAPPISPHGHPHDFLRRGRGLQSVLQLLVPIVATVTQCIWDAAG